MYCSFCNSKLPDGEAICPICGYVCRPELLQKAEANIAEAPEEQYEEQYDEAVEETAEAVEEIPASPAAYDPNRFFNPETSMFNDRFEAPVTAAPAAVETAEKPAEQKAPEAVISYKDEQDPLDKGLVSLVCGIVSILFGVISSLPFNIAGLVFSAICIKKANQAIELYPTSNGGRIAVAGKTAGTVGRVLSIISLCINVLSLRDSSGVGVFVELLTMVSVFIHKH